MDDFLLVLVFFLVLPFLAVFFADAFAAEGYATLAVDSKAKALKAAGENVVGFGAGEPDFPTPAHIVEAAVAACSDPKNHRYSPAGGLPELKQAGFRLFAFSNGKPEDVASLLENSGISSYFEDVISTDEIKSFKPNPAVYAHFLRRTGATGEQAWLISGNPFDVIGAVSAGMRAAWVKRSPQAIFDPWEIEPTITIGSLSELAHGIGSN